MATFDEYMAARDRADGARKHLTAVGARFIEFGKKLQDPGGARINERTTFAGGGSDYAHLISEDDMPGWPQAEDAIRKFAEADQALRRIQNQLTPDQRRQIQQLQRQ